MSKYRESFVVADIGWPICSMVYSRQNRVVRETRADSQRREPFRVSRHYPSRRNRDRCTKRDGDQIAIIVPRDCPKRIDSLGLRQKATEILKNLNDICARAIIVPPASPPRYISRCAFNFSQLNVIAFRINHRCVLRRSNTQLTGLRV